jgi:hypothetical protein
MAKCLGCGYESDDEADFLAHLIECPSEPESKWQTYADVLEPIELPYKNSDILEEEQV